MGLACRRSPSPPAAPCSAAPRGPPAARPVGPGRKTSPAPPRRAVLGGAAAVAATVAGGLTLDAALAAPAAASTGTTSTGTTSTDTTGLVCADPLAHLLRRA